jgi:protein AroM
MGYAERMRQAVAQASGRPVLLSNRMVAQTLAQILE